MRLLKRNLQTIWACQFTGQEPLLDETNRRTGEAKTLYGTPQSFQMNVSAARGTVRTEQFGADLDYEKVLMTDDMTCPITETSILFVDKSLEFNSDDEPLNDYVVKKVAKSLNSISYAIKKVTVS